MTEIIKEYEPMGWDVGRKQSEPKEITREEVNTAWSKILTRMLMSFVPRDKAEPKKKVSAFVARMREIDKIPRTKLVWDSMTQGTYTRAKHGELK